MGHRELHQRRAYAEHRMGVAIERILAAKTVYERTTASQWAHAWRKFSRGSKYVARSGSRLVY
jgi:hypothetical protein